MNLPRHPRKVSSDISTKKNRLRKDTDMENIANFNTLIEKSIKENWNLDALTDYKGITLQYHDVARKIEKLHIMFENSGV